MSDLRMDAYYYGFDETGCEEVDRLLSAVACAGKAFHHTELWMDQSHLYEDAHRGDTPVDWIQNAAIDAAAELLESRAALARMAEGLRHLRISAHGKVRMGHPAMRKADALLSASGASATAWLEGVKREAVREAKIRYGGKEEAACETCGGSRAVFDADEMEHNCPDCVDGGRERQ